MTVLKVRENAKLKLSNDIVLKGKFFLSHLESKLLFALISHIPQSADTNDVFLIEIRELALWMNVNINYARRYWDNLINSLKGKEILIFDFEEKQYKSFCWFEDIQIDTKKEFIEFILTEAIQSRVQNLDTNYMLITAKNIMQLKGIYTNRIYFFCQCWKNLEKPRNITIEELRDLFQIRNKYKSSKDFKKYVIDAAIHEINTLNLMSVSITTHKKANRLYSLSFYITKTTATNAHLQTFFERSENRFRVIERLTDLGVYPTVIRRLLEYSDFRINYNINECLAKNNIKNLAAYVVAAITEDYAHSYLFENDKPPELTEIDQIKIEKIEKIWQKSSNQEQEEAINFLKESLPSFGKAFLEETILKNKSLIPRQFSHSLSEFYQIKGVQT